VITYCTSGNRASEAWFALYYELGYPSARVYHDSWAVWGKLIDTPIEARDRSHWGCNTASRRIR
jgi:3-mercaptopyruvate sulfurtransferase SseA